MNNISEIFLSFNPSTIPLEVASRPQWVAWRYEQRTPNKPAKVPINPDNGQKASVNDPATWGSFGDAIFAYDQHKCNGIGYVFSADDPFVGVDLDHCRNPATGNIEPWAQDIIQALSSYTEISPSGTGVHILVKATLPSGGKRHGNIEVYSESHYFTVTGNHLEDTPLTIEARDMELRDFQAQHLSKGMNTGAGNLNGHPSPNEGMMLGKSSHALTDDEIIEKASNAANGEKFKKLFFGADLSDYNGDHSAADQSLCNIFAYYTQDKDQIARVVSDSALERKKWRERPDYRESTIQNAINGTKNFYLTELLPDQATTFQAQLPLSIAEQTNDHQPNGQTKTAIPRKRNTAILPNHNDTNNGERFVAQHGKGVRYIPPWKKWIIFNPSTGLWEVDESGEIVELAKKTAKSFAPETVFEPDKSIRRAKLMHVNRSLSVKGLQSMLFTASTMPTVKMSHEKLDANEWLIGCKNGVIDLRTGIVRPYEWGDFITKCIPVRYDPNATCLRFEEFLQEIMARKQELVDFIQRAVGYSMTRSTKEHCLFFLHGKGRNGKSTLLSILQELLGDYSMQGNSSMLMIRQFDPHLTEKASLFGKRLVVLNEIEQGQRFAEAHVKELTDGTRQRVRRMREDEWEFVPHHKIWIAGNYKPAIRGQDAGIWARIRLIPFDVQFLDESKIDRALPEKLRAELPGILNWAINGCLEYLRIGLNEPDEVKGATASYKEEMDTFGRFVEECCIVDENAKVQSENLWKAYRAWSGENITNKTFTERFTEAGYERRKIGKMYWIGIGLRDEVDLVQGLHGVDSTIGSQQG